MQMSMVIIFIFIKLFIVDTNEHNVIIDRPRSTENHRRITRIANGEPLGQDDYPYVVGLKTNNLHGEAHFCTGTLVSPIFVLTAAHCVTDTTIKEVYRNDPRIPTGEKRNVVQLFKHSLFNETSLVADLCLLKMDNPFENVTSYATISGYPDVFANETTLKCIILGWGKNKFDYPTHRANVASVWVKYGPDACRVPPDNDIIKDIVQNTWKDFLCPVPDNRMACIGDSGGALVCQGYLFGVTSHGYNYYPGMSHINKTECGDTRVQTRHIFIYKYRNWVDNIINEHGTSTVIKFNYSMYGLTTLLNFFIQKY